MLESIQGSSEFDVVVTRSSRPRSLCGLRSAAMWLALVAGVVVAIWVTGDDSAVSGSPEKSSRVLEARGGPIFALGWSPDGSKLATSRDGTTVSIHDTRSGGRRTLVLGPGLARVALGWSADNRSVMVWGLDDSAEFRPIDGSSPTSLDQPAGFRSMASAIGGGSIRLWGPEDRRINRLGFKTIRPHAMAFSADGLRVAWGGADGIVRVCDVGTGREHWQASTAATVSPRPGVQGIGAVAFSPDGSMVASAGVGPVRVWDAASGLDRARLGLESTGSTFVAFSPDGGRLAEASWDGSIRVWEPASGRQLARFEGHACRVAALAWSPDGRSMAAGTFDGTVRLWEIEANPAAPR